MIRCRIATGLHKGDEEVGEMDFPFVMELMEYWSEYPPEHLLLRAFVGFKGSDDSARKRRAQEMGDDTYKEPSRPRERRLEDLPIEQVVANTTGARHLDCAPPHVQQAIERSKQGKHLEVPGATNG